MAIGTFIISLDCEAKWGVADGLDRRTHETFTDASLEATYRKICDLFKSHDMSASFAFVAALLLERDAFTDQLAAVSPQVRRAMSPWLRFYEDAMAAGGSAAQGWHLPHLRAIVDSAKAHEIASHGFTHYPLSSATDGDGIAEEEMHRSSAILSALGTPPSSYIYARNEIASPSRLPDAGYGAYRMQRPQHGRLGRVANLAREYMPFGKADPAMSGVPAGAAAPVPAGQFFNFAIGARRIVPRSLTVRRWRSILDDAAAGGGCAHLWFHPHNAITDPGGLDSLARVLRYAAELRDQGRLKVQTMSQYVDQGRKDV